MQLKKSIAPIFVGMILGGLCQAQPTQLGIDRSAGIARIIVQGETNRDYSLVASDLSSTNWNFLATFSLTNLSQAWFDAASALMPGRFYRALKLESPTVPNTRMIFGSSIIKESPTHSIITRTRPT